MAAADAEAEVDVVSETADDEKDGADERAKLEPNGVDRAVDDGEDRGAVGTCGDLADPAGVGSTADAPNFVPALEVDGEAANGWLSAGVAGAFLGCGGSSLTSGGGDLKLSVKAGGAPPVDKVEAVPLLAGEAKEKAADEEGGGEKLNAAAPPLGVIRLPSLPGDIRFDCCDGGSVLLVLSGCLAPVKEAGV